MASAASTAQAQVPLPTTAADVPGPVPGNTMTEAYVQLVGRMAYLWGYPLVNAHNRRAAFADAPEPGLLGGVLPVAPVGFNEMLTDYIKPEETFIVCPNQDVVYGGGFTALDKEPTVVQVPDFGDRFYVYAMYDERTDEIGRIGQQYGTTPGFYMIVGPRWTGELPKGITAAVRSSTDLVFVIPRIFKDSTPEDTAAVQPHDQSGRDVSPQPVRRHDEDEGLQQVAAFPGSGAPARSAEGRKQVGQAGHLLRRSATVMKEVAPLPGEEAIYAWITSVWDAASQNPGTKKALVESFRGAEEELVKPLIHFQYIGKAIGNGWTSVTECCGVGD